MTAYAKLRPLTAVRQADVGQTFHRLADLLSESGEQAIVRFTLLAPAGTGGTGPGGADRAESGSGGDRQWTLVPAKRKYRVVEGGAVPGPPDVELVTREAVWWEIADGRLSPLDAFTGGRLRVLGDADLAARLLRKASGGTGVSAICGE
ncbi:SCP2 sterol-binding domain-containing protein [Streptomyces sp. WAC 00631]|uniref:SCP2 sterol-binding domain-containing protein n=1 Tax=unclassified Streptomyces TaxID=2593676 RepID=UPI00163CE78D|nr:MULTISPECIES: SCP2 sterol-binding domain-containing protein [unclassified Streptomyces]MCC5034809.1 SCP2 sterol-binding domain-containing protein [Streptomyces sp. WAC 00631]MCC9741832.1 SCP2 sterol-binding domain-containing protein [Streptomyces sp. MNU89]